MCKYLSIDLKQEIQPLFLSKSKSIAEFEDKKWFSDFTFLVDIVSHLNFVNTRLTTEISIN